MGENIQDPYDYEVDLRDYLKVIWRQKWLIIAVFVVAVVLAGVYSILQPSLYNTEATLLITPRVSEQIAKGEDGGLSSASLPDIAYERSALAADLVNQIITDLGLRDNDGDYVSVASLRERMEVKVEEAENRERQATQDREERIVRIPLVVMSVEGEDPERIEKIANKWIELFQKRITELFAGETARTFEFISRRFSEVKEELKAKEQEKLNYKKENPLEVIRNEVAVLEGKHKNFLSTLESKKADLKAKKSRLESVETSLADEPKFLEPARSAPRENLWNFLQNMGSDTGSRGGTDNGAGKLEAFTEFKITDQQVNAVYINLKQQKTDVQADIASLKGEISYLESKLAEFERKVKTKQALIDKTELHLKRLDREINRLNGTYNTLSSNLEEARIAKEEKESSTRIMEKAVAPEKPVSSDTKQNVAVAGVLGLFIGVLVAFFRNYMQGYGEEESEEE